MADISQTIGVDTSDAVSNIDKLTAALDKLAPSVSAANQALASFNGGAFKGATADATAGIDKMSSSAQQFTLSWASVERLIAGSIIRKGVMGIKDAIAETTEEAIKFGKEIQTISNLSGLDTGTLGRSVRAMSDETAMSLDQVSKGYSAAFKANMPGGEDATMTLLNNARNLAVALQTDLGGAAATTGGIIKGFGLSVNDSARITSELITVAQKSRSDIGSMGESFGRVAPMARALGVSFEEVSASIIALENAGMSESQAMSTVDRTMRSMASSTNKQLQQSMKELGFTTIEGMISAKGWAGTLEALAGTTDSTATGLMRLQLGARGAGGAFSLGTADAKDYAAALKEIQGTPSGKAEAMAKTTMGSDAMQASQLFEKVKNAFTVDFGERIVSAFASANSAAETIAGTLRTVAEIVTVAIPVGLTLMANRMTGISKMSFSLKDFQLPEDGFNRVDSLLGHERVLVNNVETAFYGVLRPVRRFETSIAGGALDIQKLENATISLGQVVNTVGLAFMAWGAGKMIGEEINAKIDATYKGIEDAGRKQMDDFKQQQADAAKTTHDYYTQKLADALAYGEAAGKVYATEMDQAKYANQAIEKDLEKQINQATSARTKYIAELEKAETQARSIAQSAADRILNLRDQKEDIILAKQIEKSGPAQAIQQLEQEASKLASQGAAMINKGAATGDQKLLTMGESKFTKAEGLEREAVALAKQHSELGLIESAERSRLSLIDQHIRSEERLEKVEAQRAKAADAEKTRQTQISGQADIYAKQAIENSKVLDETGKLKPDNVLAAMAANRQEALTNLAKLSLGSDADKNAANRLGLTAQLSAQMTAQPKDLIITADKSIAQIKANITKAFDDFKVNLDFDSGPLERALGRVVHTQQEMIDGFKELTALTENRNAAQARIAAGQKEAATYETERQAVRKTEGGFAETVLINPKDMNKFGDIQRALDAVSQSSNITKADLQGIVDKMQELQAVKDSGKWGKQTPGGNMWILDLTKELELLQKIADAQATVRADQTTVNKETPGQLFWRREALESMPKGNAPAPQVGPGTPGGSGITQVSQSALNAASALDKAADAASRFHSSAEAGSTQFSNPFATNPNFNNGNPPLSGSQYGFPGGDNGWQANPMMNAPNTAPATTPEAANPMLATPPTSETTGWISNPYLNQPIVPAPTAASPATDQSAAQAISQCFGGQMWHSKGYFAKGTDTIPAMLSPGETVISAAASRRFSPQLTAMNAGVRPSYHSHGSSGTSIGDVNVHVGTINNHVEGESARSIANGIRRELRRGASSLN